MIYTGTPEDITNEYDEIWFIVRRFKPFDKDLYYYNGIVRHVSNLSPSEDLLNWALNAKKNLVFSKEAFNDVYKPRFIAEMQKKESQILLDYLANTDKKVLLVCYCKREELCHRSIIKELVKEKEKKKLG